LSWKLDFDPILPFTFFEGIRMDFKFEFFLSARWGASLVALLLSIGGAAHAAIPASERAVLLELFNGANGPGWVNKSGWNGAAGTECTWIGINCNGSETTVTQIYLENNGLAGTLPALGALPNLNLFKVNGNSLTGAIPNLSGLPLNVFEASDNGLTGSLPSLAGLSVLQIFDVHSNQLTGPISDLSGLTGLATYNVRNNQLSGSIMPFSGAPSLINFDASSNQLSGEIPALTGPQELSTFRVANNQLSGNVPAVPSPNFLNSGGSSLCPNALTATIDVAWNAATGVTPWSKNCTAMSSQTITFGAQAARTFSSGGTFAISPLAAASSGLPVIYSSLSTAVCTVIGSTVSVLAAGNCIIAADQAGNASFNPAQQVTQTIVIGPASQTISFPGQASRIFSAGGTFAINPLATSSSLLTVTYSSLSTAVCTISGITITMVATGTCRIAADQAGSANFSVAPQVSQTIAISAPSQTGQTISFPQQAAVSFSPAGTFSINPPATASSGLPVTYSSLTTGVCTISGGLVTMIAVGNCSIAADQAGNAGFSAAPQVTQTIVIKPASQAISFPQQASVTFNAGGQFPINPPATASSGLPVTYTSLSTGICTVSGSLVTMVAAGNCGIAADQPGNASFSAAPQVALLIEILPPGQTSQFITFGAQATRSFIAGAVFAINPLATASSGLAVTYSSPSSSVCTVSGNSVTMISAGRCVIAANQEGSVSIAAAAQATQAFMIVVSPFPNNTTVVLGNNTASITNRIDFNATDRGKKGSVFVTGWVRVGAFGTKDPGMTDSGVAGGSGAADSDSFLLVQLTSTGWQQVVNGQLVPFASGVLGDLLSAQTILDKTDVSKLYGAEFCVGYGGSAAEMVAGGRMVAVAMIPDPNLPDKTGSCVIPGLASATVQPLTGLWWNESESGWGMSVIHSGATIFLTWYTYDPAGSPSWFVMSSCAVIGTACTGEIYNVVGGSALTLPWDGAKKVVTKVGTGSLAFTDTNTGKFNYSINGVAGIKNVTRQVFALGTTQPIVDYSALWWNPDESGWGVALTHQLDMIFVTMYTYDATGKPIWYVASSCPISSGTSCTGDLYQVDGGSTPTVTWNGERKVVRKVGAVTLAFTDASNGSMIYTINGVNGSKKITRQLF
jgi:hypothetical protein